MFKNNKKGKVSQEEAPPQEYAEVNDKDLKSFQEQICKFRDSMIASTSALAEEINIWEPQTLAPYEPIKESKFFVGANTLQVNSQNYIWAAHSHKNIMQVWKWDKKEPVLRFSMRDKLKVFKIGVHESARHGLCAGGSARGGLMVWSISTGQLLADVESAHYMEINDLAISSTNSDMIITGGKDCKVRVWMVSTLILEDNQLNSYPYAEFGDHQEEVTQVAFSQSNSNRAFSASTDKQFKVYDLSSKICIKTIQCASQILRMVVDAPETNLYVACDNQNIYCYSVEVPLSAQEGVAQGRSRQKRTLQHKKKVSALCLSNDGRHLISGDISGIIYIWNTKDGAEANPKSTPELKVMDGTATVSAETGTNTPAINSELLYTYELHKDKGAITNLIPLNRPLSLFGLTADMKSFKVSDLQSLQKFKCNVPDMDLVQEIHIDLKQTWKTQQSLQDKFDQADEDNYFANVAQNLKLEFDAVPESKNKDAGQNNVIAASNGHMSEVDKLREENKRLKRTLQERFESEFE